VALEACEARNAGRDLAREGNDILREASSGLLSWRSLAKLGKIKFEFEAMDTVNPNRF